MLQTLLCVCLLLPFLEFAAAAEEAPIWLRQAAATPLPTYNQKASYVILDDESRIEVEDSGRITKTSMYAIKILLKEGREHATTQVIYNTDTDKIREFRAWLILPNGNVRKFDKADAVDAALVSGNVYSEVRRKIISASRAAEDGSIFGCEVVVEQRSIFSQFEWSFQAYAPVLRSRLTLTLPARWTVESETFNHPEIKPSVNANSYTWELRELPYIEPESLSPSIVNIAPRLAVTIFAPAGSSLVQSFRTWSDVSQWLTQLNDPQVTLNQEMLNKAKELTVGAHSEFERIAAIARFTQDINYISIQMGLGRGGGYRPHAATEVFSRAYGDCKDKMNLMRALLKAIGVTAYPVSIFAGDRYYVKEKWPSPQQFNHCIIAVTIQEPMQLPAVIQHEKLGSLLLFDPTDSFTRLGEIPRREQGSLALLVAGDTGGLLRIPVSPPAANRTERNIDLELQADGSIIAKINEEMTGSAATLARAQIRELSRDSYNKLIEKWISSNLTGARIDKIEPHSEETSGRTTLEVHLASGHYGKLMQSKLLVFNPVMISHANSMDLTQPVRRLPIVLESEAFAETVNVKLPPEFVVDEQPERVDLEESFGTFHAECALTNGSIFYRRSLLLHNSVLSPEQYETVKKFFGRILASERSPVVLIRK